MSKKYLILLTYIILNSKILICEADEPIILSIQYINETGMVISGGKTPGAMMQGRGSLKLQLQLEKMGLWRGGKLQIMGNVTHGGNFSEEKIGDYQVASNIDAGDHIYIHELFYQQNISNFTIKLGVQDLNVDFLVSDNSSLFVNSSFGVPSVIAHGIPAPIYPLTAMGAVCQIEFNDAICFKTSFYDGLPISFENNPYNTNWHINDKHGFQFFNEIAIRPQLINQKATTLKLGFYHHTGINDPKNEYYEAYTKKNGYYFIFDQDIWQLESKKISLFGQATYSPSKKETDNNLYLGLGSVFYDIFSIINNDMFGIALAYSKFNKKEFNYELTVETFYRFKICSVLDFQPDLQYIINPGGNFNNKINNALVGFLRFILEY